MIERIRRRFDSLFPKDWIPAAFGLGVLNVALIVVHWLRLAPPNTKEGCLEAGSWIGARIWHRQLECLSANEIGDFLAGTFAPLAFLGPAAALFIQSRELRAQREELILTRREFELGREVSTEQAREARRSADMFERQTEMLADDHRRQQEEEAREAFEGLLDRGPVCPPGVDTFNLIHSWSVSTAVGHQMVDSELTFDPKSWVGSAGIRERLMPLRTALRQPAPDEVIEINNAIQLHFIAEHLRGLIKLYGKMSTRDQERHIALFLRPVLKEFGAFALRAVHLSKGVNEHELATLREVGEFAMSEAKASIPEKASDAATS